MINYYIKIIKNSFIKKKLYINNLFNITENCNSEILFLNKKRYCDRTVIYHRFSNISPNKEIDFTIPGKNKLKTELNQSSLSQDLFIYLNEASIKLLINKYKNSNPGIQRLIVIENLLKILIKINIRKNIDSQKENIKSGNLLKVDKKQQIKNKNPRPKFIIDHYRIHNDSSNHNNNIVNIVNIDNKFNMVMSDKLRNDKKRGYHKIKVIKNNKEVYINSSRIYQFPNNNNLKKVYQTNLILKGNKVSKYRGVSKNGNQW